jgi:hypothetical protein
MLAKMTKEELNIVKNKYLKMLEDSQNWPKPPMFWNYIYE